MTDPEKRDLSLRMATLAEQAGLPGELVWEAAEECSQGHPTKEDGVQISTISDICPECEKDWAYAHEEHTWTERALSDALGKFRQLIIDRPDEVEKYRIGRQPHYLTRPDYLLPLVEAWQEAQKILIMRLNFGRADLDGQWRGYIICVMEPRDRESDAEERDYPGYGQSWGEAIAVALAAVLEAEKGA